MSNYSDQIIGPDLGSGASDLRSDQREAIEKMIRKMEKSGKKKKGNRTKKKLKRLEKQLQVLAEDYQQLVELAKKEKKGKRKKGKRKKNLKRQLRTMDRERQQQDQRLQDAMTVAFLKILSSATVSVNWLPPQSQPVIELPPPRGQK